MTDLQHPSFNVDEAIRKRIRELRATPKQDLLQRFPLVDPTTKDRLMMLILHEEFGIDTVAAYPRRLPGEG